MAKREIMEFGELELRITGGRTHYGITILNGVERTDDRNSVKNKTNREGKGRVGGDGEGGRRSEK